MRTPSPLKCGLDLVPPLADRFIFGMAPSITARYFSSCPSNPTSRWTLCPPMNLRLHRPARLLHPAFGYDAPHSSARGTLTLLNNALLGAQYGGFRRSSSAALDSARCSISSNIEE